MIWYLNPPKPLGMQVSWFWFIAVALISINKIKIESIQVKDHIELDALIWRSGMNQDSVNLKLNTQTYIAWDLFLFKYSYLVHGYSNMNFKDLQIQRQTWKNLTMPRDRTTTQKMNLLTEKVPTLPNMKL